MIAAADCGKVKLMIAYRLHFEEGNLSAIATVQKRKIGDPRIFSSNFCQQVVAGNTAGTGCRELLCYQEEGLVHLAFAHPGLKAIWPVRLYYEKYDESSRGGFGEPSRFSRPGASDSDTCALFSFGGRRIREAARRREIAINALVLQSLKRVWAVQDAPSIQRTEASSTGTELTTTP